MADPSSEIIVGQEAPDFRVETPLHGTVSLSQHRGKQAVALVFFRTFFTGNHMMVGKLRLSHTLCPTCILVIRDWARNYDQIQALGSEVLAISTVKLNELGGVLASGEPRFPICADADASITKRYGVYDPRWKHPTPSAFLIDRDGLIRYRYVGSVGIQSDLPRAAELAEQLAKL